jgi:mannose-6-phosphate isomerase-like protein (cupin superfamily)
MNPKTITNPSPETSTEASTVVGPVVDAPMTGRAWWFLDTLVVEHPMATAASPVVLEQTLPAGAAPPLHVHRGLDDSWYLLEGVIVVQCGEHLLVATPGHWISQPRGVPHAFRVVGDRPARTLLVHNNPSFRDFVHDLGEPARAKTLPPPTGGPGIEALTRALIEHDSTVVGPSLTAEQAQTVLQDKQEDRRIRVRPDGAALVHEAAPVRREQWQQTGRQK